MTRDTRPDGSIATAEEFSAAMQDLLLSAHESGIDVAGAWEFRFDGGSPDWEAMIVELSKGGKGDTTSEE